MKYHSLTVVVSLSPLYIEPVAPLEAARMVLGHAEATMPYSLWLK